MQEIIIYIGKSKQVPFHRQVNVPEILLYDEEFGKQNFLFLFQTLWNILGNLSIDEICNPTTIIKFKHYEFILASSYNEAFIKIYLMTQRGIVTLPKEIAVIMLDILIQLL